MNILFYEFYKIALFVKLLSISYIGIKGASSENNPYINLNVSTLQHLDWVRVTFGGISLSSTDGAWLGVFSPSNSSLAFKKYTSSYSSPPWTENAPLKYVLCPDIPGCQENGESYVDFCLENTFEVIYECTFPIIKSYY